MLLEAMQLIEDAYRKNPAMFCGKKQTRIIGGLIYLLGLHHRGDLKKSPTQGEVLLVFNPDAWRNSRGEVGATTIRNGFKDWLKILDGKVSWFWREEPDYTHRCYPHINGL